MRFSSSHYQINSYNSLYQSNVQSDMFCWQMFHGTTESIKQTVVITAARYCSLMNTLTSTLFLYNSFNIRDQTSQSSETNANITIRPKPIISGMFLLIPVIYEKMICQLSLPLLSLCTETLRYDTSAVLQTILWLKADRILVVVFTSLQFVYLFLLCHVSCSKLPRKQSVSSRCTNNT